MIIKSKPENILPLALMREFLPIDHEHNPDNPNNTLGLGVKEDVKEE